MLCKTAISLILLSRMMMNLFTWLSLSLLHAFNVNAFCYRTPTEVTERILKGRMD